MRQILILLVIVVSLIFSIAPVSAVDGWNNINAVDGDGKTSCYTGNNPGEGVTWACFQAADGSTTVNWNPGVSNSTWIWNNPTGIYYSKWAMWNVLDTGLMSCNGDIQNRTGVGSAWLNFSISGNGPVVCRSLQSFGRFYEFIYMNGTAPQPEVNFTGNPIDGFNPLKVDFTIINSSGMNSSAHEWNFGDGSIFSTNLTSVINHTYQNAGIYTVSLKFYNLSGTETTITKNNYILASSPSGMIVNLDVKNGLTGALIQDATVGIKNTSTGVWRNTTAPTGLVYFSTTDPGYLYPLSQGQSITLAANKSGYKEASETFAIPYNNYRARLFLMPDSITNATGAGTVVVNAIRNKDGLTISGVSVVMDTGQVGLTNTAGATTLFNVTAGNRVVKLSDPDGGYMSTEKSFNLTAGETKLVVVEMVRVGETPVVTRVSPTPTGRGTYDPNNPNSPVYGNYTTSEINEQGGAGVLGMLAQLIQLWPLAIVMLLMKALRSAMT